jgi:hypothetical protein
LYVVVHVLAFLNAHRVAQEIYIRFFASGFCSFCFDQLCVNRSIVYRCYCFHFRCKLSLIFLSSSPSSIYRRQYTGGNQALWQKMYVDIFSSFSHLQSQELLYGKIIGGGWSMSKFSVLNPKGSPDSDSVGPDKGEYYFFNCLRKDDGGALRSGQLWSSRQALISSKRDSLGWSAPISANIQINRPLVTRPS